MVPQASTKSLPYLHLLFLAIPRMKGKEPQSLQILSWSSIIPVFWSEIAHSKNETKGSLSRIGSRSYHSASGLLACRGIRSSFVDDHTPAACNRNQDTQRLILNVCTFHPQEMTIFKECYLPETEDSEFTKSATIHPPLLSSLLFTSSLTTPLFCECSSFYSCPPLLSCSSLPC